MNLKNTLISAFFLGVITLLLLASVYNGKLQQTPAATSVGPMQISKGEIGITLSQGYRGKYYTVSPFNDFYIASTSSRSALITQNEIERKSFTNSKDTLKIRTITDIIGSYFGITSPTQKFTASLGAISYDTKITDNTATISYSVLPKELTEIEKMGITLTYNADDIIFDRSHNVYNSFRENDIENFEKIYDISLARQTGNLLVNIPGEKLFIYNPKGAYLIRIDAQPTQQITLNKDARFIEITQNAKKIDKSYKAEITLTATDMRKETL